MRWKDDREKIGIKITVTKFLLFPLCINKEWRWFEKTSFEKVRYINYEGNIEWHYIKWLD